MSLTCPKCHGEMRAYERNGVTVDQCADCRGLFLDRGELEKLVDAEGAWQGAPPTPPPAQQPQYQQPHHQQQYSYGGKPYQRKKKSFLSELFDD